VRGIVRPLVVVLALLALAVPLRAASPAAVARAGRAAPKPAKGKRNGKPVEVARGRKAKERPAKTSTWIFQRPANVVPNQQGKVVVFPFRNDDGDMVSTQVAQLLEARGLEVVTGVRPVDSVDQYRDVATHLGLAAYVDGDVRGGEAKTRATIRLRSGYTGRSVLQATFTESRANLPRELSDKLWTKVGSAMARVCEDATKPRKPSRTTLQINAGTPIETVPRSN
jgi:hypothetical protein